LACLRLLGCKLIDPNHDHVEVVKRCLQGEEVPLDVQGVRERVLRIGRVGQVVGDEKSAELCGRWLIAQLKVNLRPLWSPSASALSSLGQRFGELVWRLLFEEVRKVGSGSCDEFAREGGAASPLPQDKQELREHNEDDPWEEERSWRDPSFHHVRLVVAMWNDSEKVRLPKVFSIPKSYYRVLCSEH
jgi:U3 small nucleolar RNA-associated protein 20